MSDEAKCNCQRCGEHIEFPVMMAGQETACPHCGRETTLMLPSVRKAEPVATTAHKKSEGKLNEQPAAKILKAVIVIAAIIAAIVLVNLYYNWRVDSLTRALAPLQLP